MVFIMWEVWVSTNEIGQLCLPSISAVAQCYVLLDHRIGQTNDRYMNCGRVIGILR